MRKIQFSNNQYYHVYNRGVDKRDIFIDEKDYQKFLRNLKDFNNKSYYEQRARVIEEKKELSSFLEGFEKVVEVIAYSLAPNHFHLILKQLVDGGVSNFMHKTGTSFTNYFNKKYNRSGSLFQGTYKVIQIQNDNYLLWLSGYINGNIEIHKIEPAEFYKWASFKNFLNGERDGILGDIDIILSQFKDRQDYKNFINRVIQESRSKKEMEKYLLEEII
ncbi:MAG: transposase [Candidatus Nealsonbacteria bacterium]